jgi:hypothetical protein
MRAAAFPAGRLYGIRHPAKTWPALSARIAPDVIVATNSRVNRWVLTLWNMSSSFRFAVRGGRRAIRVPAADSRAIGQRLRELLISGMLREAPACY